MQGGGPVWCCGNFDDMFGEVFLRSTCRSPIPLSIENEMISFTSSKSVKVLGSNKTAAIAKQEVALDKLLERIKN
jgi:hypothetical protein